MPQFQHPTVDNFGAGVGGAPWFSTESTYAAALVAAEAVNPSDTSKFIYTTTDIAAGNFSASPQGDNVIGPQNADLTWTFNAVTDPGVNTGHIVRLRLKVKVIIIPFGSPPAPWPGYNPAITISFAGASRTILLSNLSNDVWTTLSWTMTSGEVDFYRANGGYAGTDGVVPRIGVFTYGTAFPPDGGSHLFSYDLLEVEVPDPGQSVTITGSGGLDTVNSTGLPGGGGGFDLSGFHLGIGGGNTGGGPVSAPSAGCPPDFPTGTDSAGGSGCTAVLPTGSDSAGGSGCGVSL